MILILAEDYPSESNKYALTYIHTRNLFYKSMGMNVTVLNFRAKHSYIYEGITVISNADYENNKSQMNIEMLLSHAPNLRNHLIFIKKNLKETQKLMMFFHGHEVLKVSNYYPKPFPYTNENISRKIIRDSYDLIKLPIMRLFIKKHLNNNKLSLIFVSDWMREQFEVNVKIKKEEMLDRSFVISNSAHPIFLEENFDSNLEKKIADFITIRPFDNPKYGVDIVRELALKHPHLTFHVYGKGAYFSHYSKPANITIFNEYFSQTEMPELLNKYKAALMPTRLDAQGVTMCEMATFGIPIVTSDIPICTEMLSGFENTFFVNNDTLDIDLTSVLNEIKEATEKKLKFSNENTVQKEVNLIKKLTGVD